MAKTSALVNLNLGLYLGWSPLTIPARAMQDGMNFRIKDGKLNNRNLGWEEFSDVELNGPVTLIARFSIRGAAEKTIFGTPTDLYEYDPDNDLVLFLTPRYATGTVDVTSANPAVVTANSGSPTWDTAGVKEGDEISFGDAAERDPEATWYTIDSVDSETQLTLTAAVTGAPLTGSTYTIRQKFSGTASAVWVHDTFVLPDDGTGDDLWFATNGLEFPVTWNGSDTQVTVRSALGFVCKTLGVYKNMMIYGNVLETGGDLRPTTIINSDIGKPLDVSNGLAGEFRVHDGVDGLVGILDLGDNMVLYAERHVVMAQFVGDPLIFIFREAANGVGPLAPRLIADFGDYHEFIGPDSQYLFDGVSVTEVGKQVWREVLRLRDPARHNVGFCHFDEENGELIWAVALTSDSGVGDSTEPPERAYVEHYLEEVDQRVPTPFSLRQFPFASAGTANTVGVLTWDELTGQWEDQAFRWNDTFLFSSAPITVAGGADGKLWTLNVNQLADGTLLPSHVTTGRRFLGDGRIRGLLTRIYAFAAQLPGPLSITVLTYDSAAGPNAITDTQSFDTTLPQEGHFTTHYRRGRYFEVKFSTTGVVWELEGYDVDMRSGGRR